MEGNYKLGNYSKNNNYVYIDYITPSTKSYNPTSHYELIKMVNLLSGDSTPELHIHKNIILAALDMLRLLKNIQETSYDTIVIEKVNTLLHTLEQATINNKNYGEA